MHTNWSFLPDTYTWRKFDHLYQNGWKEIIVRTIKTHRILCTREVIDELKYRKFGIVEDGVLNYVGILPALDINYQLYDRQGFDKADASLIEYAERREAIVVTEDHPMLALGYLENLDFIQTIDFFHILWRRGTITQNQMNKLLSIFRGLRNITKKKERSIKRDLRE